MSGRDVVDKRPLEKPVVCDTDWWRSLAATNTVAYRIS
jgi:hypothetical protein